MSIKRNNATENSSKDVADLNEASTSFYEKNFSSETEGKETNQGVSTVNEYALGSLVSNYDSSDSTDSNESQDT